MLLDAAAVCSICSPPPPGPVLQALIKHSSSGESTAGGNLCSVYCCRLAASMKGTQQQKQGGTFLRTPKGANKQGV